ncbi:M14 family metallopeptidase [Mumia qirimensis]|uniref:M14 family metallopeptidase n=1 Tax=Mumia qirimensis TaxID=3234852 RepID=UPI00351D3DBE
MRRRSILATAGLVVAGLIVSTSSASTAAPRIPDPPTFFGFEMGAEGQLADFASIKEYLQVVADKSNRVEYEVVDRTTEGEDFPILRISSPTNLDRVDEILDINARLADPQTMREEAAEAGLERDAYARKLAATSLPVYYVEAGIHSTEVGNTQALMDVVHRLATDDSAFTKRVLKNMVVLVVPSQNPDGHNRVVNYFNETAGTDYARVFPDLYQKYVGHDNNRDWFMVTQKESKIRVALEQKYRPTVQHYMHQAGTNSPRIWSPPWDEPMSRTLDPLTVSSANSIGQETQRDLIAEGKPGAKTDDAYGIMWNADVMGYSTFQGTTTWLTEIASARDLAYTVESEEILQPNTATLRSPLPYDKKTWSLSQIVDYAESAAYSGLDTVAANPQEWLYNNMYLVNRNSETWTGGPYAYVVPSKQRDAFATYEMLSLLHAGKARIEQATSAFQADGKRYGKGSWILRTNQPMGRWVDQQLRVDEYPDSARKCTTCPLIMPYSETTDNLGLLMGVTVKAVEDPFAAATRQVTDIVPTPPPFPAAPGRRGAYLVSPESYGVGHVITALERSGVPAYRLKKKVSVLGKTLPPGALVVPAAAPGARGALQGASAATGLQVHALARVPRAAAVKLAPTTRVGLVRGANNMPGGWMWWMLEQYGANVQVVEADDYAALDQFDTIVLAPGVSTRSITDGLDPARYPAEFHWARGVPEGPAKLAAWVKDGGNLVALGSASITAASALSLPLENVTPSDRAAFTAPGALLEQRYDRRAAATWGMPAKWPVWFNNDPAFAVSGDGQVAASYPDSDDLLVSGYARGTEAIAGAANVVTFDVGKGNATVAGGHITFRTWPRAAWTIVTNAIYNGAAADVSGRALVDAFGR